MCGIAGVVYWQERCSQELRRLGQEMAGAIAHRGPDGQGVWIDAAAGVSLAHRRLSIIDLSETGGQPMISEDGRYVLVFNGEIYNHHDLRRRLEQSVGHLVWQGRSDTEVLLAAIRLLGLRRALTECVGMFALALWDRKKRVLSLARDRVGEKPLYYGRVGGSFVFASELKSLRRLPGWPPTPNLVAMGAYLRFGYVPAPWSIYTGIAKLKPGHLVEFSVKEQGEQASPEPYWHLPRPTDELASVEEVLPRLEQLLTTAVARQMEADVPLGCFLSGGIDSSLIAALMQSQSTSPVRSFSIGFEDAKFNEAPFAAAIACHLGTTHTELYVDGRMALDSIPELPSIYDEPFGDSSQIPTLLLSRMTRQHVTVALSGDAGDEMFGGYDRYELLGRVEPVFDKAPLWARSLGAGILDSAAADIGAGLAKSLFPGIGGRLSPSRIRRIGRFMRQPSIFGAYKNLVSQFDSPASLGATVHDPPSLHDLDRAGAGRVPAPAWAAYIDGLTYLPDDILVKVDRASMAASLEVRVPFLDVDVVEFASQLNWKLKVREGRSKWPLRAILEKHVPRDLFERPKQGFGVPLSDWLRSDLREWAEHLLAPNVGMIGPVLDHGAVESLWREHLEGKKDNRDRLWVLLSLQQWAVANA